MSESNNISIGGNENEEKENRIEKLVNKNAGDNHLKNLYENVGTRVSKLREINESIHFRTRHARAGGQTRRDKIAQFKMGK